MPIPRTVTHFNKRFLNPVMRRIAVVAPMMGVIHHTGRASGTAYQTPVMVFRRDDRLVVALTYGPDVDWVRNVLAAGSCVIHTRGQDLTAREPGLTRDDTTGVSLPAPGPVCARPSARSRLPDHARSGRVSRVPRPGRVSALRETGIPARKGTRMAADGLRRGSPVDGDARGEPVQE